MVLDKKKELEKNRFIDDLVKHGVTDVEIKEKDDLEVAKSKGLVVDKKMIEDSIMTLPDENVGSGYEDFYKITSELTKDENVFKFGNVGRTGQFWRCLGKTVAEYDLVKKVYPKRKGRYILLDRFMYNQAVDGSSRNGELASKYIQMSGDVLGFRGALQYREAGVMPYDQGMDRKRTLKERILGK